MFVNMSIVDTMDQHVAGCGLVSPQQHNDHTSGPLTLDLHYTIHILQLTLTQI